MEPTRHVKEIIEMEAEIARLTAIIDRLNMEIVDLRKDKERLDWLNKADWDSGVRLLIKQQVNTIVVNWIKAANARAAIDAAMNQTSAS